MERTTVASFLLFSIVVNLVIGGEQGVGKSTLFRHLQKSSSVVRKEVTDPLFSTIIHWKNPYTGEMADVTSS